MINRAVSAEKFVSVVEAIDAHRTSTVLWLFFNSE